MVIAYLGRPIGLEDHRFVRRDGQRLPLLKKTIILVGETKIVLMLPFLLHLRVHGVCSVGEELGETLLTLEGDGMNRCKKRAGSGEKTNRLSKFDRVLEFRGGLCLIAMIGVLGRLCHRCKNSKLV